MLVIGEVMNVRGKFIVFEGIDGCGKTTQINALASYLEGLGRKVYITSEPTISMTGGILRDALSGVSHRTAGEMAAMFVLDRIFHNVNNKWGIEKMLADGYDVLCDRYYYSSLAYQGSETDYDWVKRMNLDCPEIRTPDACIFLDLTPEESLERISRGRATTEIYETLEKLTSVRNTFHSVLSELSERDGESIFIVSAAGNVEEVSERIRACADKIIAD